MTSDIMACRRCGIPRAAKPDRPFCMDCHRLRPARPAPKRAQQLAGYSIDRAAHLVCLVRDEGRDGIGDFLDALDLQRLYALTVTLAAMVPDDRPVEDLLAWVKTLDDGVAAMVPEVSAA